MRTVLSLVTAGAARRPSVALMSAQPRVAGRMQPGSAFGDRFQRARSTGTFGALVGSAIRGAGLWAHRTALCSTFCTIGS